MVLELGGKGWERLRFDVGFGDGEVCGVFVRFCFLYVVVGGCVWLFV